MRPGETRTGVRSGPGCRMAVDCTYMWLVVKSSCSLLLRNSVDGFFLERHEPKRFFLFFSLGLVGDEGAARSFGELSHLSPSSFSWDLDLEEARKIFLNLKGFGALMIASGQETLYCGEKRARSASC